MTSRRYVMTSLGHAKLFLALLNIEILIQMWIRYSTKRVSHWSTWQTCYKMSCRHDVMSWSDVMTSFWHRTVIPNSIQGLYFTGMSLGHFTTYCYRRMTSWRVYMTSTWHGKLLLALFQLFCLSRDNNWTLWHAYNKIGQKSRCHDELNLQSSFYVE